MCKWTFNLSLQTYFQVKKCVLRHNNNIHDNRLRPFSCNQRRRTTRRGCWTMIPHSRWSWRRGSASLKRSTSTMWTTTCPPLTCRSTAGNVSLDVKKAWPCVAFQHQDELQEWMFLLHCHLQHLWVASRLWRWMWTSWSRWTWWTSQTKRPSTFSWTQEQTRERWLPHYQVLCVHISINSLCSLTPSGSWSCG